MIIANGCHLTSSLSGPSTNLLAPVQDILMCTGTHMAAYSLINERSSKYANTIAPHLNILENHDAYLFTSLQKIMTSHNMIVGSNFLVQPLLQSIFQLSETSILSVLDRLLPETPFDAKALTLDMLNPSHVSLLAGTGAMPVNGTILLPLVPSYFFLYPLFISSFFTIYSYMYRIYSLNGYHALETYN